MSSSFRDLRVWRDAMKLAIIYRATAAFPKHELYGLSQQMRRAAVSVPSNIAEGKGHHSDKAFTNSCFTREGRYWNCRHKSKLRRTYNTLPMRMPSVC
jgi:hypothetical protein